MADEEDPFEIGGSRVPSDAVKAAPKPTKGRLHRVKCPMCDTPGFIPRSAAGRPVRCANPECLVPVFTPDDGGSGGDDRRSAQSGDSAALGGGSAISPSAGSPLRIYAIAAAVLLPLAGGLVWYLSRPSGDEDALARPADIDFAALGEDSDNGEPTTGTAEQTTTETAKASPREEAERLIRRMISTARLEGNRDKIFARRLTADGWFRLGERDEAARELSHLATIARQTSSERAWLGVEPRLTDYWQLREAGATNAANELLAEIRADAEAIPTGGRLTYETVIGAAAAIASGSDIAAAGDLVASHDRDRSVVSQRDVVSSAAWFLTVSRLRAAGLDPLPVGDVFAWRDPVRTAVAVDLASRGEWKTAIDWCVARADEQVVGDSLAVVAQTACRLAAEPDTLSEIRSAAVSKGTSVSLRVDAVVAGETEDVQILDSCRDRLDALPAATPMSLPPLRQLVRSSSIPEDSAAVVHAAAAAEVARAAVLCSNQAVAESGIRAMYNQLAAVAPPTPAVRRAILELETRESRVEQRISEELRITTRSEIASRFRQYRRSLDAWGSLAERRRLYLIQRLARIARAGGVDAVRAVLDDDAIGLKAEVVMDELARLLAAAAARDSRAFESIRSPDEDLIVPRPSRMEALPEAALSTLMTRAWRAADAGQLRDALKVLDSGRQLPGFRESLINEIVEDAAATTTDPGVVYSAIAGLRNPVWREEALQIASRILARRGMASSAETWLDSKKVPPTELVTAFYGLTLGLLEQEPPPASE